MASSSKNSNMEMVPLRHEFRRYRKAVGGSQKSVAHELGITQAALSAWERGVNKSLRHASMQKAVVILQNWKMDNPSLGNIVSMSNEDVGATEIPRVTEVGPASSIIAQEMTRYLVEYFGWLDDKDQHVLLDKVPTDELMKMYMVAKGW